MKESQPTGVYLLSPPGRSAVAVLAVVGPRATMVVDSQFCPALRSQRPVGGQTSGNLSLGEHGVGRILFGRWGGARGEEVVVCRRQFQYQGAQDEGTQYVEVHCHGGRQAAKCILDSLVAVGCQARSWQAWVRQQAGNLLQAEAHTQLAAAQTQRTAAILLDQYQGALGQEILTLKNEIVACRDHPHGRDGNAERIIEKLLARVDLGRHLTWPWQVLLAGRPNVGKSSLVNALLGYQRAIVFDQPGTTRDILSATTAMQGWPVQLSDTAGMHETSDPLELQGIRLARAQLAQTDLLVWVLDASVLERAALVESCAEAQRLAQRELAAVMRDLSMDLPVLVLLNKIDMVGLSGVGLSGVGLSGVGLKEGTRVGALSSAGRPGRRETDVSSVLRTSAITGAGIESTVAAIATCLVPWLPTPGDAVPFNERQQRLLQRVGDQLQQANFQQAIAALDMLLGIAPGRGQ